MADLTTFLNSSLPQLDRGLRGIQKIIPVVNASAASGDNIQVLVVPIGAKWRLHAGDVRHDATLGASATAQLRVNRATVHTALSGLTTAGAAGKSNGAAAQAVPFDLVGGDIIEINIAGAGITATANLIVDLIISTSR